MDKNWNLIGFKLGCFLWLFDDYPSFCTIDNDVVLETSYIIYVTFEDNVGRYVLHSREQVLVLKAKVQQILRWFI